MPRRQYAPALSKAAFKQQRPKGNYQSYLNYLKSKRPGWDPERPLVRQVGPAIPRPTPQGPPLPTLASLLGSLKFETPQQIEARANRMLNQQIKAQRGLISEEYAQARQELLSQREQEREEAQREREAQQAAGRAAAAMNAELMGRIGSAYSGGAGEISGLAGSLGAAAAGATAADVAAANQSLAAVGAPNVVVGGPVGAPGIAGAQQAAVEIFRGGTLPANQMGAAGVAGQTGLYGLIASQNLRATQEAQAAYIQSEREHGKAFQQAQKQARDARSRAVRELTLGRPQAAAGYLAQLQEAQRQQVALAMSLIGQRSAAQQQAFTQGMTRKQWLEALRKAGVAESQWERTFAEQLRQAGVTEAQWAKEFAEKQRQYNKTLAYNKSEQARLAKQWKAEQRKTTGKQPTPQQYIGTVLSGLGEASYDSKFQNAIASIYYGQPTPAQVQPVKGSKDERKRTNAVINYLMSVYWPNLNAMVKDPKLKAQLRVNFENSLRSWWTSAPLPGLQAWKLSALKG